MTLTSFTKKYHTWDVDLTVDGFTPGAGNLVDTIAAMTEYSAPMPPEVYYYQVKVIDLAGNVSGYSDQIKIYEAAGTPKPIIRYRENGAYVGCRETTF